MSQSPPFAPTYKVMYALQLMYLL